MPKKVTIDINQLQAFCRMKPTLADCAAFFKCSEDTIERRIRKVAGVSFAVFREQNMVQTRFDLIRSAIQKSERSDTMHIFCLKNLCDWKDRKTDEADKVIVNQYDELSDEELDQKIAERVAAMT